MTFHWLLISCIVASLYNGPVFGFTVPEPLIISSPGSTVATLNSSLSFNSNSTLASLNQEQPPPGFKVEYIWKTSSPALDRIDTFNTILFDMAYLAVQEWDRPIFVARCPVPFRIAISFVANRGRVTMQVKCAMWVLKEVFDYFVQQGRYAPGNFVVDVASVRLGVGNVKYVPATSAYNVNASTGLLHYATANNSSLTTTVSPIDMTVFADTTLALNIPENGTSTPTIPPDIFNQSTNLTAKGRKDVTIDITYRPHGSIFPDTQMYNCSLQLLIRAAEAPNMHADIGSVFSMYNDLADFTFSLVPEPFVKGNELSWLDCINSISSVIMGMESREGERRWAEVDGIIRDKDVAIGRFCIEKGDFTEVDPSRVCDRDTTVNVSGQKL